MDDFVDNDLTKEKHSQQEKEEENEGEQLVDISFIVEKAAHTLTYSNPLLCRVESFSLQDSMAALELMDPIMDCCEIDASCYNSSSSRRRNKKLEDDSNEKKVPPQIAPKSLKGDAPLPWDNLTFYQAYHFVLKEICCLDSMICGSSVIESTFTCLYAHDGVLHDMRNELQPHANTAKNNAASFKKNAPKWTVYASSLILVKLCEAVRKIVIHADIYEEEDFTPNADPFQFFPIVEEKEVVETLSYVINQLSKLSIDSQSNDDYQNDDNSTIDIIVSALDLQLQMFLSCCTLGALTKDNVKSSIESVKNNVNTKIQVFNHLLLKLDESEKDGVQNNNTNDDNEDNYEEEFLHRMFDPYVNRRLLGSTPVRKTKFKNVIGSIQSLKGIYQELDWAVCDLFLEGNTLGRIQRMISHISISSVNILSRSIINLNLYFDDLLLGQYQLGILIIDHMQQIGGVPQTLLISDRCLSFLHRMGKPVYDTLKVLLLNRNRQGTFIDVLMLKDWVTIQKEASAIDYLYREELNLDPRTTPFATNYVLSTIIWILTHHLSLAVELDLFTGHYDLSIAYWYLDFLLSNQMNISNSMLKAKAERLRIQQSLAEKDDKKNNNIANDTAKAGKGKKKGKKGSNNLKKSGNQTTRKNSEISTPEVSIEDLEDHIHVLVLNLKRTLCRGTVRFIAALNKSGVCKKPQFEFTSHEKRFEKRFKLFQTVSHPAALKYDDYNQGSDFSSVSLLDLINSSSECFKSAKVIVDTIVAQLGKIKESYHAIRKEELTKLAKVCVGNSLYLHKLLEHNQKGYKSSDLSVQFDFKSHNQYCSIIL